MPFFSRPPDPVKGGFNAIKTGLSETLFKLGRDLKPEPWLATGARKLDGKMWEVTLRQGVKFHDGASMDAAAVKASLERAIAESATARALLDIAQVEVKDPSTITITTNNPSPILPALLAEPTGGIVNAAAAATMVCVMTPFPPVGWTRRIDGPVQDSPRHAAAGGDFNRRNGAAEPRGAGVNQGRGHTVTSWIASS